MIRITQKDPEPLQIIQKFFGRRGLRSSIYNRGVRGFELEVWRVRDVERIVKETERFLILERAREQYRRFKELRKRIRRIFKRSARESDFEP